jgi:hypothetical protein
MKLVIPLCIPEARNLRLGVDGGVMLNISFRCLPQSLLWKYSILQQSHVFRCFGFQLRNGLGVSFYVKLNPLTADTAFIPL